MSTLSWTNVKWRQAREALLKEVGHISPTLKELLASLLPKEEPPRWVGREGALILYPEKGQEVYLYAPYTRGERKPHLEVFSPEEVIIYDLSMVGLDLATFRELVGTMVRLLSEVAPHKREE